MARRGQGRNYTEVIEASLAPRHVMVNPFDSSIFPRSLGSPCRHDAQGARTQIGGRERANLKRVRHSMGADVEAGGAE